MVYIDFGCANVVITKLSVKRERNWMNKCCQTCSDQHAPDGMEPCKTCVDVWARGGERYTKWSTQEDNRKTEEPPD